MRTAVLLVCMLGGCGRLGFGDDVVSGDASLDGPADSDANGGDAGPSMIQHVQQTAISFNTGQQTLTLPDPSAMGSLLVITAAANDLSNLGLPAGWVIAAQQFTNGACAVAIAYYANNPGGIASVAVNQPSLQPTVVQLTEWTGAATTNALDAIGTTSGMSSTMQSVQTATATTEDDEVAIDVFCEDVGSPTYTPQLGWTNLGSASNGSSEPSFTSEYRFVQTPGVIGETVTSNFSSKYSAAIATFRPR